MWSPGWTASLIRGLRFRDRLPPGTVRRFPVQAIGFGADLLERIIFGTVDPDPERRIRRGQALAPYGRLDPGPLDPGDPCVIAADDVARPIVGSAPLSPARA